METPICACDHAEMVERQLRSTLERSFEHYPLLTLTGPRQAGKTTLARSTFPHLAYANLEAPDERAFAQEDPRGFLAGFPDGAILDEFQRVPELASHLQVLVDEHGRNGLFVLTGGQQLAISESVGQSLAGRTGVMTMLALSIAEADAFGGTLGTSELLHTGFFPRIYDRAIPASQALGDYVETYVERDVRSLLHVRDLTTFQTFLRLCAGRVGQLLNVSNLAADAGIAHSTAREWLSILEAGYVVFRLPPHHANISKRLVKSPKLYFYDVGLASYLLGIEQPSQIPTHPLRGALFENLVVVEALKHEIHAGRRPRPSFLRTARGFEVDLLWPVGPSYAAIEIKAGRTLSSSQLYALQRLEEILPEPPLARIVVHDGEETVNRSGVRVTNPRGLAACLGELRR